MASAALVDGAPAAAAVAGGVRQRRRAAAGQDGGGSSFDPAGRDLSASGPVVFAEDWIPASFPLWTQGSINLDGTDVALASAEFGVLNQTVVASCDATAANGVGAFVERDISLAPGAYWIRTGTKYQEIYSLAPVCTSPADAVNALIVDGAEKHLQMESTSSGCVFHTEPRTLEGCVMVPPGKTSVKIRLQSNVTQCGKSEARWTSLSVQATNQTVGQKCSSVSQCCGSPSTTVCEGPAWNDKTCQTCRRLGRPCTRASQCCGSANKVCEGPSGRLPTCKTCGSKDAICARDTQCCSGYKCKSGKCAVPNTFVSMDDYWN
jgi:hypothetical protein